MATRRTTKKRKRRLLDAVKIAHTAAFELCEGGTCPDPGVSGDKKNVFCKQGDECKKGGCYCQLFHRAPDAGADEPWVVAALNGQHEAKHEPKKWSYKCICVRPILETTHKEGTFDYTVRYQICEEGTGGCTLDRVTGGAVDKLACTGKCGNELCKCTLFKLTMGGDPAKAKWELAAAGGKQIDHQKGYYYRCFCLK